VSRHRQFFSWITADLQRSGLKFQTAELSLLCLILSSICVFFSESLEWFPVIAFRFFYKTFATILVALIMTDIIIHFLFHIIHIFIYKRLYFSFFPASFCTTFATSFSMYVYNTYIILLLYSI
jgi:hypothetical protein